MNPKLLRSNVLRRIYADAKWDALQKEAESSSAFRYQSFETAKSLAAEARAFRQIETAAATELLDRKESLQ